MPQKASVGRLALRVEGEWWNGYWAPRHDSMEGAVQIASVRMTAAANDEKVKAAFIHFMQAAFASVVMDSTGLKAEWEKPVPAPEHERAGSA